MSDDIDIEYLIGLVSQNPCIWDKTVEEYHSRTITTAAWNNVCCELNEHFEVLSDVEQNAYLKGVLKKWRNIKDQWLKATKKLEKQKKTGETPRVKPYIYHDQLRFLYKTLEEFSCAELPASSSDPGRFTPGPYRLRKTKATSPTEEEIAPKLVKTELDIPTVYSIKDEDPKVMFFKGILPHMTDFSDDENLQFQSGVLTLIQKIRKERNETT